MVMGSRLWCCDITYCVAVDLTKANVIISQPQQEKLVDNNGRPCAMRWFGLRCAIRSGFIRALADEGEFVQGRRGLCCETFLL